MSGGPHHNPHRPGQPAPAPAAAPAWNHLQVPFFSRQPQNAHMSSERPLSHSPLTWHTPTPPEHQQPPMKGNPYRHTPTPPDLQILKGAPNAAFRHTPTPPDRDSLKSYRHTPTPPDQCLKGQGQIVQQSQMYRHTPTPPDAAHGHKAGVPLYRHTPPPEGHKAALNPLFNLQQMISDNRSVQAQRGDSMRDNLMARTDNMTISRHSPGLALGSMDLSVTRSPRNGNQNGEMGVPISLSVRDATKINSLDSAEITKIHQVPVGYMAKGIEFSKSSSPTLSSMGQGSNSPKSPKSNKRPVKKVDSILERLNSGGDGVVITPLRHTQSPHSVIVSAHSLEDSNSRGSSSSLNITPVMGVPSYPVCEPAGTGRATPPANHRINQSLMVLENLPMTAIYPCLPSETADPYSDKQSLQPPSVIMESVSAGKDESRPAANCSNEDSNGSSSDGGRSKRRRKQLKTSKIQNDFDSNNREPALEHIHPMIPIDSAAKPEIQNHTAVDESRVLALTPQVAGDLPSSEVDTNANLKMTTENGMPSATRRSSTEDNTVSVVSKARRKTCSESETIDNIAAMIASTDSTDCLLKTCESENVNKNTLDVTDNAKTESILEQTESLKNILCSPEPEVKEPVTITQAEVATKPQRRKRNSKSNSTESLGSETGKEPESQLNYPTPDAASKAASEDKSKPEAETTSFVEVENELEKMFAGIEECPTQTDTTLDPITGLMTENDPGSAAPGIKMPVRKKRASRRSSEATSVGLMSSDENTPKKKRKSSKRSFPSDGPSGNIIDAVPGNDRKKSKNALKGTKRNNKKEKTKDLSSHKDAYDSGSNASSSKSRGPYVQIRGPRDSPLSVSVINTPVQEEDTDRPLQKVKNLKIKAAHNSDSDFRNKVKSKGLHSSTLSMKYDATTTDTSWICVFCKRGPHTGGAGSQHMGDLFGPYIVTTDCPDYASMMSDPRDTQFKGRPKQGTFSQNRQAKGKRLKVEAEPSDGDKFPNGEMYVGMTEATSAGYEVWLHEECAVWAPGLYLVGARLVGLEGAVWGCCTVRCGRCGLLGASVACVSRGCRSTMHVSCARADCWSLSREDFVVRCREHGLP